MLGTVSGSSDAGLPDEANGEKYVVYNLTPNMWEEPWVRHLLAELPISRYAVKDLWSPPTARPRIHRLSMFLESLLPAPFRPTRRMLRRVVNPEDFNVFVYNTWGLDSAVRIELSKLLARFEHVGIVSVDEPTRDSKETYKNVTFALRIGFHAKKYQGTRNLLVAPLGVPKNFIRPQSVRDIMDREFSWSFLGEIKNMRRKNMVDQLKRVRGDHFFRPINSWNSEDSLRGARYSSILADSIFVPSPPGNVHCECYRTYEALECDSIPVVDDHYYRDAFGAPFPIVEPDWEDAPQILNWLLDNGDSLERLHRKCRGWWEGVKKNYPRKARALADEAHAAR
jgi:hypothetical protein